LIFPVGSSGDVVHFSASKNRSVRAETAVVIRSARHFLGVKNSVWNGMDLFESFLGRVREESKEIIHDFLCL
jgi:hypothetical protein